MATHLLIVACILATASAAAAFPGYHGHVKPSLSLTSTPMPQGFDCSTVAYELLDCVAYMTIPSLSDKPSKTCCLNLLSVINADADCVCVAIDAAPSMGFQVNYTRALSLPTSCHLNVPNVDCHLDVSPTLAPMVTPVATPAHAPMVTPVVTPAHAPMVAPVVTPPALAPTQAVDCSTVVYELIDCVPYMTIPSQTDKPSKGCCDNLLSVMKAYAECVCVALEDAPSMGFQVNYTRALSLSKSCHLNVPAVDCHLGMSPSHAPMVTPAHAPKMVATPTHAVDCSTVVYELIDCVPYMTIPSESDKPNKGCCDNLLSVMKVDAECVCVALETAPSMGFQVNYTRALSLSKACHLNVPHVNCHIDMSPSEAPSSGSPAVKHVPSPSTASPMPKRAAAPVGGSSAAAEAPAVKEASGSSSMSASMALVSMIVAALSYTLG